MPAIRTPRLFLQPKPFRHVPRLLIVALLLTLCGATFAPTAAANAVPYVDVVSPVSVNPGATNVTLTVLGTGFINGSTVKWNATALTTTFVSAKKLTAAVPDSLVAAQGLGSITVFTPTPFGGTSNVVYVPVAASEASTVFPSTPSSSVTVGTMPQGIVTADLNGDGKLDLIVANQTDGTVTVLLGNGDGTFTTKSTPAAGAGANWVAVGDFNEDGIPDLAVANASSPGPGGVRILLGVGDGTFTAGASLTTGDGPFSVTTADFNGDGHLDLAVTNENDSTVSVFRGNGNGTFAAATTLIAGDAPQQIVAGDFNEDGDLDLAVTNEDDNTVSVFFGTGTGAFGAQHVFSTGGSGFPIGLIAADFNGDSHLDLAAVNASDVAILTNNGAGAFTLTSNPATGSGDLIAGVAGDYNGDGNLDIVVSDRTAGEAFLLLGNGSGSFGGAVTFTTASGAFGVATADFNGDGALDLAVANGAAGNVSIFLQTLPVNLSPTSLAFGSQPVGVMSSPAKTVIFTNNSGLSVTISSIAFTGANNGDFSSGGTCSTEIPVTNNSTCTITVTFTPGAAGAREATLTVTDSAGNSPQTLAVTGTGTASVPTISKTFGAAAIPLNGTTSLSFTISNPAGGQALTGVGFTDAFPAGLLVATPNGLSGTCGAGTITATTGANSINLSGGTLAAGASTCTFQVNVVGTTAGAQANTTGILSSNETGAGATSNTATVTVIGPPTISKTFGAASIPLNGSTSLSFTINNPNAGTALSAIGFADTFPAGLQVATPNGLTGTCGGGTIAATAGSGGVTLSGSTIAASSSCTFSVNVTGITAGTQNNLSGTVTSTQGGTGNAASASINVEAPPSLEKVFGSAAIAVNTSTTLTFTITNPAANAAALTGIAFTDTFPTGIVVATPNGLTNTCGGTVTAVAGSGSVSVSGGSVSTSSSCTVTVNVTATTSGNFTNTTGNVTSTNGGTGNTASANLSGATPPVIAKTFGAATIPLNGSTSLSFTITNPVANSGSLTGLSFTDSLPAGLVVSTPNALAGTCGGGTITAVAASSSVTLAAATLAASGACTFSVNATGTTAGVKNNSVAVASTNAGTGNTSNASLTVIGPPILVKTFGAASVPLNGTTSLTFTPSNPNATAALTGVGFADTLPAGLVIATPNALTNTCGGTPAAIAGTNSVTLSAATLAASASCTLVVNVTGTAAGAKSNTTGAVQSTEGGTGGTASASLTVEAPPTIAKVFGAATIALNGTTSLTFTITNPVANTASLTGVAFTDTLPSGIVVSTPNGVGGTCGGTPVATSGSAIVSLSGTTVATNTSCTLSVNITATGSGPVTNTTGNVTSTNGGTGNSATANLTVGTPPVITNANSATFTVGIAGSFTITTTGSPTPSITETGTLPAGLTFTDNGNGTATLSGTPTASGTAGSYTISFTAHNGVGTDSTQTFTLTVGKGTPVITWATPSNVTFGTPLSATQLDATANVAGTFAYSPAAGVVPGAGPQTLSVTFTPTDVTDFNAATANVTLTVNKATPSVTWAAPGAIGYGTALGAAQLNATANVAGTFTYTPPAGTIENVGPQTLSVTFTPTDTADYLASTIQVALPVNAASTTVILTASPTPANPGATVTLTATATSTGGIPTGNVTFFDNGVMLATVPLTGGVAAYSTSVLSAGPHTITATYAANGNFAGGASAAFTETIVAGGFTVTPTITAPVVQSGQAANIPIAVVSLGGVTGQVQFSVVGLPIGAAVSFAPNSLSLSANPSLETLTITTQPRFNYLAEHTSPISPSHTILAGALYIPIFGMVLGAAGFTWRRNRKGSSWFVLLILLAASGMIAGCASRSGFQDNGTPAGSYPLTITAVATTPSGTIAQTTTVILTVR